MIEVLQIQNIVLHLPINKSQKFYSLTKSNTMNTETTTFGELTQGTVINFYRSVTAEDVNYVVLRQFESKWGHFTEVLNLETFEKDSFTQHSIVQNFWSIVKAN